MFFIFIETWHERERENIIAIVNIANVNTVLENQNQTHQSVHIKGIHVLVQDEVGLKHPSGEIWHIKGGNGVHWIPLGGEVDEWRYISIFKTWDVREAWDLC